jgi:hypothetical protein
MHLLLQLKLRHGTMTSLKLSKLSVTIVDLHRPDPRCNVPNVIQTGQSAGSGFATDAS